MSTPIKHWRNTGATRMKRWTFTFDGITGRAERMHNSFFIVWGGMGFHFNAANADLAKAILSAEPA
jgi:hypothetical protein